MITDEHTLAYPGLSSKNIVSDHVSLKSCDHICLVVSFVLSVRDQFRRQNQTIYIAMIKFKYGTITLNETAMYQSLILSPHINPY